MAAHAAASLVATPVLAAPNRRATSCRASRTTVRAAATPSDQKKIDAAAFPNLCRRDLLAVAAAVAFAPATIPAPADAVVSKLGDFAALRADIKELMSSNEDLGPTIVRLAWHSSGTYDKVSRTGGSGGGTIRFKEELAHGGNAGLDKMVAKLEPIKEKHPDISYADLYTFAGKVAIEEMGGPAIGFKAGRVDEMDPSAVTPDGRLPAADKGNPMATAQGLRDTFYKMGFDDREIVALSGAHALGRCHADASGYVGPWTGTPTSFNNSYFVLLKGLKWTPNKKTKKFQYADPSGRLMMLPSDIVLLEDEEFKKYVLEYAKDQKMFFKDFAAAFQKLEELGTKGLKKINA